MNPALQTSRGPGPWSDEVLDGLTRLVIEGGRLELDRCFTGVTSMLLSGVHIPSLGVLAQLPALTDLCLAACQVDDWTWPAQLRLEELELTNMGVSPEQLGRHPAISTPCTWTTWGSWSAPWARPASRTASGSCWARSTS